MLKKKTNFYNILNIILYNVNITILSCKPDIENLG